MSQDPPSTAERREVVLNAAALMPADRCEGLPEAAHAVNAVGAGVVAAAAQRVSATCLYVSTDFVFSGDATTAYGPDDHRWPLQVYGQSKKEGEDATRARCARATVVRTASLFRRPTDAGPGRIDLVARTLETLRRPERMRIVADVVMSPTFVDDAASMILALARHPPGTYHAVNEGVASWYELCVEAAAIAGLDISLIEPVSIDELHPQAPRPRYAPLSPEQLPPDVGNRKWVDALRSCLAGAVP